jgi:Uma2 family endonuclease
MTSTDGGNFSHASSTDDADGSNVTPMSAEPIGAYLPSWQPNPVRQNLANYRLADVLDLPPDSPRVELVDGRMLPLPPPQLRHQIACTELWLWLRTHAPAGRYLAIIGVGIAIADDHSREPDVVLLEPAADKLSHFFSPGQITLAVEVVSPNTRKTDRFDKPAEYAAVGVPHYWRVELDPATHIYAYRLGKHGGYDLVTDGDDMLELDEPFPIKLGLTELTM